MLDPRRTPVEVSEVNPARGSFVVRVCAFEDEAAQGELPLCRQGAAVPRLAGEAEAARLREASGPIKQKSCLSPTLPTRCSKKLWICRLSYAEQPLLRVYFSGVALEQVAPIDGSALVHLPDAGAITRGQITEAEQGYSVLTLPKWS